MYSTGRRWCEKGYALSDKNNFLEEKLLNCECLTDANKNLGNISKAFEYLTEYYAVRDTIQKLANLEELTRLELKYEFDKQQKMTHKNKHRINRLYQGGRATQNDKKQA